MTTKTTLTHMPDHPPRTHSHAWAGHDLAEGLQAGSRRDLARVLTELERMSPLAAELLRLLSPHTGKAVVLGITGPPGAGKSTLVNALIQAWRLQNRRVAVIAVDPSSPISGGAILGDRIRMTSALDDDGVFVRSLASGGHLGGLSPAAVRMIDALDAAGFDLVLLETVGTGQSEIDVAEVADVRVVIAAPGLGDDIQAMKSGLLEIADILVVNKADSPLAERTRQQLVGALSIRAGRQRDVPVLKTTATTGQGIAELTKAIARVAAGRLEEPVIARRRRRARYLIRQAASQLIRDAFGGTDSASLDTIADAVLQGAQAPSDAARALLTGHAGLRRDHC